MSIKENVKAIKDELSHEEKLFQGTVQLEYFYKKYKMIIWAVVIAVAGYFITSSVVDSQNASRIERANVAFNKLLADADDAQALKTLQSDSKPLYDLYRFQKAIKESDIELLKELRDSKAFGISDMAKYQYAMLSGDQKALKKYIDKDGLYFKDIAILNSAATLLKQSKIKEAHKMLDQIDPQSPFANHAKLLRHYGNAK